jgi:hypothetical protein
LGLGSADEGGCGFVKLDPEEVRERKMENEIKKILEELFTF